MSGLNVEEHLAQLQTVKAQPPPSHILSQSFDEIRDSFWRNFNHQHRRLCIWLAELVLHQDQNLQRFKDFLTNQWRLPEKEIETIRVFVYIELEKMVDQDPHNGMALYLLGQFFHYDWGQASDPQRYWDCAVQSANLGCAWGISSVGFCYDQGKWVEVSHPTAKLYYEASAAKGCPIGYWNWGVSFLKLRDDQEANKRIKQAAQLRYSQAMNRIAQLCPNPEQQISIYTQAVRTNRNPFCLENLAFIHAKRYGINISETQRKKLIFLFLAAGKTPSTISPTIVDHEKINFNAEVQLVLERPEILRLLLVARLKEPNSFLYKDFLPFDIFKVLIQLSQCLSDVPPTLQQIFDEAIPFDAKWLEEDDD